MPPVKKKRREKKPRRRASAAAPRGLTRELGATECALAERSLAVKELLVAVLVQDLAKLRTFGILSAWQNERLRRADQPSPSISLTQQKTGRSDGAMMTTSPPGTCGGSDAEYRRKNPPPEGSSSEESDGDSDSSTSVSAQGSSLPEAVASMALSVAR